MPAAFDHLISATTVHDITDALDLLSSAHRIGWRYVGNNENNLATINLGSDPAAGVIERVTNAIDAILEREWNQQGQPTNVTSPRQAVSQWFGIEGGHLSNVEDLRASTIVSVSGQVEITLRDSERRDRPTIDIRDYGVGIKADDFNRSILSLNGSRKLRKLFLAGAFGQGGSTALSYSLYTLIFSRAAPSEAGGMNPVAVTLVRFNPGDPRTDKHGVYEYMIDHRTGHPFTFEVPEDVFPSGTLVRHVSMDLGKYSNIMTAPTGSLWYLTQHYLFDPVLPFRITDRRSNSIQGSSRTVAGNRRLLTFSDITEYTRSATLTFRDGTVVLSWWVLSAQGESARNRITQYTLPSKPIIITFNGQKQGELPNTIIKNDLRLPYLERYIIVHIDCDRLDSESRRQLFPSTRENVRDTAILDDLRRLVVDTLAGDPELQRLDRERKVRYIRRVESESVENIRRRLANRVRTVVQVSGGGRSPRVTPPDSPDHPQPRVPIPVQEPPTFLEIISPSPRKVYAGQRFIIRFRTDADPAYFLNPDTFIAVLDPPTFGQYTGTTNVINGYGTAYFRANEDLDECTTAEITLEVRPRRSTSLHGTVTAEVVPLPTPGGSGSGQVPTPNINPQWVTADDVFWTEHGWNDTSVARVERTSDSIDVYVSAEQRRLSALIARAQRRETSTVDSVKDFYLEHISFYAVLAALEQQQVQQLQEAADPEAMEPQEAEQEQERELHRACEMLCGVMEDMFDVVVNRDLRESDDILSAEDDSEEQEMGVGE